MTVIAIGMCKDEADVAEGLLRHLAGEVDHIIIADNDSVDGTRDILHQLTRELPLTVLDDPVVAYNQSAKMSALAELAAAEHGPCWIAAVDFDELWGCPAGRIRDFLPRLPAEVTVVPAALTNHLPTALDTADEDPFRSMVWRQRAPQPLGKMAFLWEPDAVIHQGNHGVTLPSGQPDPYAADWAIQMLLAEMLDDEVPPGEAGLQIRHFPIRSADHMVRKAQNGGRALAATDLPYDQGGHWRSWYELLQRHGVAALEEAYRAHWFYVSPVDAGLVRDPAPYRRWVVDQT